MAQIERVFPQAGERIKSIEDLARLRLVTGSVLLLVSLVGVLGADWDIQWHAVIGRDQTFTPPHDLILLSIGLSGIVALVSILIETTWSGRHPDLRAYCTDFLGLLRSSLGLYLVGFGAVCSAVAFPLDTYWHALYGIDVSLWAPFHTMIYMGSVLSTFGVLSLLFEAAHLAKRQQDRRTALFSYAGLVATLGILLSKLSTFLTPALSGHTLRFGAITLNFFPFLLALVAVFVCVLAERLLPWMGAATMVVIVFLLVLLLVSAFVPPMITLLVQAEHETYLARASRIGSTIVPLTGQTPVLLLLALCLDGVVWLGRHSQWVPSRQTTWMLVAALASMVLVAGVTLLQVGLRAQAAQGGEGYRAGHLLLGFLLALLLTVPGSLLGQGLAQTISRTLTMSQTLHARRR